MTGDSNSDESSDVNISKLRELALRGKNYREEITVDYLGEELTLYVKALTDGQFLPIAAYLDDKLDMDTDEAKEALEEDQESDDNQGIDPSNFDAEFVGIMQKAAVYGIDTEQGDAEGMTEDEVEGTVEMLMGGKSLEIAERVMAISSDAEKAESFRRDGGGE